MANQARRQVWLSIEPVVRFWLVRNSRTPFSIQTLLLFGIFVGITRGVFEHILLGIDSKGSDILAYVPFYLSLPFLYSSILALIPGVRYERTLQPVTFATLLGILPPLFDFGLHGVTTHNVFYGYFLSHDYQNFPWLGYAPQRNYPLGEAFTIWLTIIFAATYVYAATKRFTSALLGGFLSYVVYILYSLVIPGALSYLFFGFQNSDSWLKQLGAFKLRPLFLLVSATQILVAWIMDTLLSQNCMLFLRRIAHTLPFVSLTILGAAMSGSETYGITFGILVTLSTGIAVTAQNDLLEAAQADARARRGLDLANLTALTVYVLILFSGYKLALFGFACFSLSILYHYPAFNIRQTLFGSMKVEGFWGLFTFLTGVYAGSIHHPNTKILLTAFLVFGGFSLFSTFKDAKDAESDAAEGRRTIYTHFRQRGKDLRRFHWVIAVVLGLLVGLAGILYFPANHYNRVVHLICVPGFVSACWRIEQKKMFQLFLILLSVMILNLAFYEISLSNA